MTLAAVRPFLYATRVDGALENHITLLPGLWKLLVCRGDASENTNRRENQKKKSSVSKELVKTGNIHQDTRCFTHPPPPHTTVTPSKSSCVFLPPRLQPLRGSTNLPPPRVPWASPWFPPVRAVVSYENK